MYCMPLRMRSLLLPEPSFPLSETGRLPGEIASNLFESQEEEKCTWLNRQLL